MNEIEKPVMEESRNESTAPSTEEKEAFKPNTGHDTYKTPLDSASSYEPVESEGTFTVKDGVVVDETEKKQEQSWEYSSGDKDAEIVATTPDGKKIQIVKHPKFGGYVIEFTSGGQLPPELGGTWTNYERAKEAIRVYLGRKAEAKG